MLDEVQKCLETGGFDYLLQYGSDDLYRLMIRGKPKSCGSWGRCGRSGPADSGQPC